MTERLHFHFSLHALEKEMATHSSVLAWRIPGIGEPGGLPSMGWHRVGHYWSDLAAATVFWIEWIWYCSTVYIYEVHHAAVCNVVSIVAYLSHHILAVQYCCLSSLYCVVNVYGLFTTPFKFVPLNNINLIPPSPSLGNHLFCSLILQVWLC